MVNEQQDNQIQAGTAAPVSGPPVLVRQPILDRRGLVHGYQILYQHLLEADQAEAVLDAAVVQGMEALANGFLAFVPTSAAMMIDGLIGMLPVGTVLELESDVEPTEELLAACRSARKAGYHIAVAEQPDGPPADDKLLDVVDYVKVHCESDQASERARALEGRSLARIATRVESLESYQKAAHQGYDFFQGFFFCHPEPLQSQRIPPNRAIHLQIMQQLQRDPLELKTLVPLVQRDAALVYRLLRLVNSPLCAMRQTVQSVETAILVLGEKAFRRLAMLAILSELSDGQPAELLQMALIRARFCELGAALCGLDAQEQYLLGMLSLLPAMLRRTMPQMVAELPLREAVRQALLGDQNHERALLSWIEQHEQNQIRNCYDIATRYELNTQRLEQFHVDAVVWNATAIRARG